MLVDLEKLVAPFQEPQKAPVCIAGGGIAGLVLATTLADAGIDVHLLEAGGRSIEDRSQEIYEAEMAGATHEGSTLGRFRMFGGTSTRWGGQILPFTSDIFRPDPAMALPGWPIEPASLESFYSRIETILGTDNLPFTVEICDLLGFPRAPPGLLSNPHFNLRFSKWAPFSHRNLSRTLGAKAIASSRITVFLHANVTECLLSSDGARVEAFLVRNYRGDQFRFEAEEYVLAAGTIEATRLLLASRSVHPRGVGNAHGQVGLYLHDHVSAPVGLLSGDTRRQFLNLLGGFFVGTTKRTGRLEANPSLRQRLGLLAVMAHLRIEEPEGSGAFVARQLMRARHEGDLSSALRASWSQLPPATFEILRLMYYGKIRKRRVYSPRALVTLHIDTEQRPTAKSCLRLSNQSLDRLNMPKAVVDWRVSAEELDTIRKYAEFLRHEFVRIGLVGIDWFPDLVSGNDDGVRGLRDTNHLMGGTIMGTDPSQSVVDTDLRVHGISQLSIASLSTFPRGGSSNPTFTMIALTLRLAERLKRAATTTSRYIPTWCAR
jgi:choline dehydrogenase-like flavoprotein